jgi:hypothetical protein|eukprot:COSAG06_NODE_163_length_21566_cov_9.641070_11_plen_90_part_00
MSEAIEHAEVFVYGVSLKYKESINCRMEANYAFQSELDMIPLMVEKDYVAKGWLGLILGTRLWYAMHCTALCAAYPSIHPLLSFFSVFL